jgi:hypothetical protein
MVSWNRKAMKEATQRRSRMSMVELFYCRSKKRRVQVSDCLERYVDANAFDKKRSACWRCYQGKKTRTEFSHGA